LAKLGKAKEPKLTRAAAAGRSPDVAGRRAQAPARLGLAASARRRRLRSAKPRQAHSLEDRVSGVILSVSRKGLNRSSATCRRNGFSTTATRLHLLLGLVFMTDKKPGRPPRETSPQQKALVSFPLAMHSQLRILSELHGIPMTQIIRAGVADRIALLLASSPPKMF